MVLVTGCELDHLQTTLLGSWKCVVSWDLYQGVPYLEGRQCPSRAQVMSVVYVALVRSYWQPRHHYLESYEWTCDGDWNCCCLQTKQLEVWSCSMAWPSSLKLERYWQRLTQLVGLKRRWIEVVVQRRWLAGSTRR